MAIALTKLASHYWRPDFGEAQAKQMIRDYVEDLEEFSVVEVEAAARDYRRNPKNEFFPRSGQLRDLIYAVRKDRADVERYPRRAPQESRPIMWWMTHPWKPHWRESEIPEDDRPVYERRKAKAAAFCSKPENPTLHLVKTAQ